LLCRSRKKLRNPFPHPPRSGTKAKQESAGLKKEARHSNKLLHHQRTADAQFRSGEEMQKDTGKGAKATGIRTPGDLKQGRRQTQAQSRKAEK